MHFTTITTIIAAIASTAAATPAGKPAPVAKVAPDNNLAVVVIGAIKGFGYEQTTTPLRVPFGKLTHFEKLQINSLEFRGVMVSVKAFLFPKDDKPGFKKGEPAVYHPSNVREFGWVLCRVEQ
ncbi:hypothetical protein BKA59DRAFT_560567 [Fusarium tricinctum]|uniref:Uncharacterized protein n=1 Tax=Fusarium tricinctum TaxID=61284 RepID=A0A8K0W5P6_9HYPO|nr:hypothetical protein BKA59DRAFT_560567 [Fusarium tricinctum]